MSEKKNSEKEAKPKASRFLEIEYTIEDKNTGKKLEEEKKVFATGMTVPIAVWNEKLESGKVKESETLELQASEAFGKKNRELLVTMKEQVFTKDGVRPVVGQSYFFGSNMGRVKSVNAGRVLIDFNHPYAGKDIKVEYTIVKEVTNKEEQGRYVLEKVFLLPGNTFKVKGTTITLDPRLSPQKEQIAQEFSTMLEGFTFAVGTAQKSEKDKKAS